MEMKLHTDNIQLENCGLESPLNPLGYENKEKDDEFKRRYQELIAASDDELKRVQKINEETAKLAEKSKPEVYPDKIVVDGQEYRHYIILFQTLMVHETYNSTIHTYFSLNEAYNCLKYFEKKISDMVTKDTPVPVSIVYRNKKGETVSYATLYVVSINHNIPTNLVKVPDLTTDEDDDNTVHSPVIPEEEN